MFKILDYIIYGIISIPAFLIVLAAKPFINTKIGENIVFYITIFMYKYLKDFNPNAAEKIKTNFLVYRSPCILSGTKVYDMIVDYFEDYD